MRRFAIVLSVLSAIFLIGGAVMAKDKDSTILPERPMDKPVFVSAGGCFWCTESEFRGQKGVLYTRVGYTGGDEPNPTYKEVSAHKTGHAEAVEVTFDPDQISYEQLIEFFLTRAHDPTEKDRQGPDIGHQYRSAIFYGSPEEKTIAEKVIAQVNASKKWDKPIVTTLEPLKTFWEAEEYHQQYYEKAGR